MSKRLDSTRLQHLQYAAERLLKRMYGTRLTDFLTDEDLQDIALRQFTVMDEAAAHVSDALRRQYPQIDWRRACARPAAASASPAKFTSMNAKACPIRS